MAIMASKGEVDFVLVLPGVVGFVRSVAEVEERRSVAVIPPPPVEEEVEAAWIWEAL